MDYTARQIENAIISALSTGMTYLTTCQAYTYELDELMLKTYDLAPFALVEWDSSQYADEASNGYEMVTYYNDMLVKIHVGSLYPRTVGAVKGAMEMLDDVRDIIAGSKLSLHITPIDPVKEYKTYQFSDLKVKKTLSIYTAEYQTRALYETT